jgi:hypothetical protein
MASMEDTSDCESVVGVFTLVKKVKDVKEKMLKNTLKGPMKRLKVKLLQILNSCIIVATSMNLKSANLIFTTSGKNLAKLSLISIISHIKLLIV